MSSLSYLISVVASLLLHGLLVLLMLIGWQPQPEIEIRSLPNVVRASLVELEAKAKPKPPPKQEVIDLTAQQLNQQKEAEQRRIAREKAAREKAAKEKAEKERKAKDKAEREAREQSEAAKRRQEELARQQREQQRLDEFNQQLLEDEQYQAELEAQQLVQSVNYELQRAVELNWNPPPSARRGMQALLVVSLAPNGGLISVDIVESSGDSAFDRSAVLAVRKTDPFEMVRDLDRDFFEKYFRTFNFLFAPKDLRL